MSDLISRQAVMDTTKTVMKDILDSLPTTLVDGEEIYDVRTSELDFILNINKALQNAIKALPSETHEIRTETHGVCSDAISRQAAIDAIEHITSSMSVCVTTDECHGMKRMQRQAVIELANLPSAEPQTERSGK